MIGSFINGVENLGRGTGYMANNVDKYIFPKLKNIHQYNLILLPGYDDIYFAKNNKNIIWCHVPAYEIPDRISIYLADAEIKKNTVAYIVQSEFQKKDLCEEFDLDKNKVFVLNNAFIPMEKNKKQKNNHIQFFCAGQFSRGIDMLVEAFENIKDDNISLILHGCTCNDCLVGCCDSCTSRWNDFPKKINDQNLDKRIKIVGWTDHDQYIKNMKESDIMSYPCTFQETACIQVMEAMSAGLKIITSDLGALPDTTGGYATIMKDFPKDNEGVLEKRNEIIKFFTKEMKKSIKEIRKGRFDPTDQINYINNRFTWENTEKQWLNLDKYLQSLTHSDII
jgi:glycosyltransferase involved in cell wall biosynthesis